MPDRPCTGALERSRTMEAFNTYSEIFDRAERLGRPFQEGKTWYPKAHDRLSVLADRIGASTERVAGAAAWMSPMTQWETNMQGMNKLVSVWDEYPFEWKAEVANRYTTYYGNGVKAIRYLNGNGELSGPKVTSFAKNLSGDFQEVTIDSWMYKIVGKFGLSSDTPTENAHRSLDRAVRMIASLHGIEPAHVQAIIWGTARNYS